MTTQKINDGTAQFFDDPSDIAAHAENALRNIEAGQPYITDVTLKYWENEAIARFAAQTSFRPTFEPDKLKERELWLAKWANEARHASVYHSGLNPVARAAVRVLLGACELNNAILDKGDPQKIAALSMLLVCEVLMGGYMLEVDTMHEAKGALDKAMKNRVRKTIGKQHDDLTKARNGCISQARIMWVDNPTLRIGQVAEECRERLLLNIEKLPSMNARDVPDIPTIKSWLKEAAAENRITIPDGAQKPGRPKGK